MTFLYIISYIISIPLLIYISFIGWFVAESVAKNGFFKTWEKIKEFKND